MSFSTRAATGALFALLLPFLLNAQSLAWARSAGGSGADEGRVIAADAAGNVFMAGSFSGTADFDPGPGVAQLVCPGFSNGFFAKYDATGQLLWARQLRTNGVGDITGLALAGDGGVYVSGRFLGSVVFDPGAGVEERTSGGSFDGFVARYTTDGVLQWARLLGGALYDEAMTVGADAEGHVVVAGSFNGAAQFESTAAPDERTAFGEFDIFLARYSAAGELEWLDQLGGPAHERVLRLAVDAAGQSYLTGNFRETCDFDPSAAVFDVSSTGEADIFLAKYDAAGALAWAHGLGTVGYDEGRAVACDATGAVYLTGGFAGTLDFDPGPAEHALSDAGIIDVYIAKYTAGGEFEWARTIGGPDSEYGNCIAADAEGNVYVGGQFLIELDFDPTAGETVRTSHGDYDVFLAKYRPSGELAWVRQAGGNQLDEVWGLALDAEDNLYTTGFYKDAGAAFDHNGGNPVVLPAATDRDVFFAKYSDATTAAAETRPTTELRAYPVPASTEVRLEWPQAYGAWQIAAYDQLGRLRARVTADGTSAVLPVSELENGVYRVVVSGPGSSQVVTVSVMR
jgi:hypothetical protein